MTRHSRSGVRPIETGRESVRAEARPAEVLLIEANHGDVRLLCEHFAEASIEIRLHVVDTAPAALDFVHQRGEYADAPPPDVVCVDLHLFEPRSEDVIDAFRDDAALGRTPVVVLTSSKSETNLVRSADIDVTAYLEKPLDPDAFVDCLRRDDGFALRLVCEGAPGTTDRATRPRSAIPPVPTSTVESHDRPRSTPRSSTT